MRALTLVFFAGVIGLTVPGAASAQPTDAQLRYVCKDFVMQALNDPRGAQLDWTNTTPSRNKDETYTVEFAGRAVVDGSMRKAIFQCVIIVAGKDSFRAKSVRVRSGGGL